MACLPCMLMIAGVPSDEPEPPAYLCAGCVQESHAPSIGGVWSTPDDVRAAKLELDNAMVATNRQWEMVALGNASNNPKFTQAAADDYFSWDAFFNTWNTFVITDSSVLSAGDDMDRVHDYAGQLSEWQARLVADTQSLAGGPLTPILAPTSPSDSGGILGRLGRQEGTNVSNVLTPILWGAGLLLFGFVVVETLPVLLHHRRYA